MDGLICFQSVSILFTSPLMLAVFTLKEAMPPFFLRKKQRGPMPCFSDSKLKFFTTPIMVKGMTLPGLSLVYIFFPIGSGYHKNFAVVSLMRMDDESPP